MMRPAIHAQTRSKRRRMSVLMLLTLGACSDNMQDQPRVDPLDASGLFEDGAGTRPPVPGTVALEDSLEPELPPEPTLALLELGQARFNGVCAACHAEDGYGDGPVVQRGFPAPVSLHEQRLREADDAHLLQVIEQGQGKMPAYGTILDRRERYAVVAYVRALQLSQHADASSLPEVLQRSLPERGGEP